MADSMNILILSCGTRNKIVQYFKKELVDKGLVVATDCSKLAPALYEADKYFIVPRVAEEDYLDVILSICKENNIKAVLSLIDPELNLLSLHKQDFLNIGTMPIISEYDVVEMSFNKYSFYKALTRNKINTVRSYIDISEFYKDLKAEMIDFPVFVKPIKGSASINIKKVISKEELELLFTRYDNLMIQKFMNGTEYGADVYIDMISNELVAIFIKEKILMRAGETYKSVSVKDEKLLSLIKKFVKIMGYKGIIDIDIFKVNGKYYISEVNPRFGGGYPHAYECGINIPKMIIENIKGYSNKSVIDDYSEGTYMMKYIEIKFVRDL